MVGAKWDVYAGADECYNYEHAVRGGLDAAVVVVGALGRTPAAGDVGQLVCATVHCEHAEVPTL